MFSKLRIEKILLVLAVCLLFPTLGSAQQPTWLSLSPGHIYRPGWYQLCAGNGAWMTLDVYYGYSGGGAGFIYGWPNLGGDGCANIYADQTTGLGPYTFWGIKNTEEPDWVAVLEQITIDLAPSPPPQPTSMAFNPNTGYAGNQNCYVLTIGNASSMTVDLRYRINGVSQPDSSLTMDGSGQWPYCPQHYDATGLYEFTAIKNHSRSDWVTLSPATTYYLGTPIPTSLSISPASTTAGAGSYRMTVGNGALVVLNTKFSVNGGPAMTAFNWPSLAAYSSGSPTGIADITTWACSVAGVYNYSQIANASNGIWVSAPATETINSTGAPSVTAVTPAAGSRGTNVDVTITGSRLCGTSSSPLTTNWTGLTFSGVSADASSVQATFNIAPTTNLGNATVTLNAGGGSTTFVFSILPPIGLTKEYIYLGPRVIATEAP